MLADCKDKPLVKGGTHFSGDSQMPPERHKNSGVCCNRKIRFRLTNSVAKTVMRNIGALFSQIPARFKSAGACFFNGVELLNRRKKSINCPVSGPARCATGDLDRLTLQHTDRHLLVTVPRNIACLDKMHQITDLVMISQ